MKLISHFHVERRGGIHLIIHSLSNNNNQTGDSNFLFPCLFIFVTPPWKKIPRFQIDIQIRKIIRGCMNFDYNGSTIWFCGPNTILVTIFKEFCTVLYVTLRLCTVFKSKKFLKYCVWVTYKLCCRYIIKIHVITGDLSDFYAYSKPR